MSAVQGVGGHWGGCCLSPGTLQPRSRPASSWNMLSPAGASSPPSPFPLAPSPFPLPPCPCCSPFTLPSTPAPPPATFHNCPLSVPRSFAVCLPPCAVCSCCASQAMLLQLVACTFCCSVCSIMRCPGAKTLCTLIRAMFAHVALDSSSMFWVRSLVWHLH